MAKGYPDFFGFSMFPHYGSVFFDSGGGVVAGGDTTGIFTVSIKGQILSLYLKLSTIDDFGQAHAGVIIDGTPADMLILSAFNGYAVRNYSPFILVPVVYDITAEVVVFSINPGVTFNQSFGVELRNFPGQPNLTYEYVVHYYKVVS